MHSKGTISFLSSKELTSGIEQRSHQSQDRMSFPGVFAVLGFRCPAKSRLMDTWEVPRLIPTKLEQRLETCARAFLNMMNGATACYVRCSWEVAGGYMLSYCRQAVNQESRICADTSLWHPLNNLEPRPSSAFLPSSIFHMYALIINLCW